MESNRIQPKSNTFTQPNLLPASKFRADPEAPVSLDRVAIIGAGLIGTSIARSLVRLGVEVTVFDPNPEALRVVSELNRGIIIGGSGVTDYHGATFDLAIVAAPAPICGPLVVDALRVANTVTDVSSVKRPIFNYLERAGINSPYYVSSHPMAGREVSGAAASIDGLFLGRPWVILPDVHLDASSVARVEALVHLCGAELMYIHPEHHDHAVALISHLPQIFATIMAAQLVDEPQEYINLSGPGITDVTRIAASDPKLWREILLANSPAVTDRLLRAHQTFTDLVEVFTNKQIPANERIRKVEDLLSSGVSGRSRIPGKQGKLPDDTTRLRVMISDKPGQLAKLFSDVDAAQVNIEDVAISHAASRPMGMVEIQIKKDVAHKLRAHLEAQDWIVHRV